MDHLIANRDVAGSLNDLISKVVDCRKHARHQPSRDAAAVDIEVFPRIDFVREVLPWSEAASQTLDELLSGGRHRWNASIRRIHDKRRLTVRPLAILPIRWRDRKSVV